MKTERALRLMNVGLRILMHICEICTFCDLYYSQKESLLV